MVVTARLIGIRRRIRIGRRVWRGIRCRVRLWVGSRRRRDAARRTAAAEVSDDPLSLRSSVAEVSEAPLSLRSSVAERAESLLLPRSTAARRRARFFIVKLWVHIRFNINCIDVSVAQPFPKYYSLANPNDLPLLIELFRISTSFLASVIKKIPCFHNICFFNDKYVSSISRILPERR